LKKLSDYDYQPIYDNARNLFEKYPQLIDRETFEKIIPYTDYVQL